MFLKQYGLISSQLYLLLFSFFFHCIKELRVKTALKFLASHVHQIKTEFNSPSLHPCLITLLLKLWSLFNKNIFYLCVHRCIVRVSVGILCGVILTIMCLLSTLLYPAIRHCVRLAREEDTSDSPVTSVHVQGVHVHHQAYTVYDQVDLLLPAQYSDTSLDTTVTTSHDNDNNVKCQAVRRQLMSDDTRNYSQDSISSLRSETQSHSRESILWN